jgi:hypothetical protein
MVDYKTRFIAQRDASELVNLYHLARVPLSGTKYHGSGSYERMLWASGQFAKLHPEVTASGAYKDLDGLLA